MNSPATSIEEDGDAVADSEAGVHYWNVMDDLVYSDQSAAELFGFSGDEGMRGMPIQSYIERMHPEDLPRVSLAIQSAMQSGAPYHEEYRIIRPDRTIVEVVAIGRWFRDGKGEPHHYSGILFAKSVDEAAPLSLQQLCLIAHDMARAEGHAAAAEKIIEALACLDVGASVVPLRVATCH